MKKIQNVNPLFDHVHTITLDAAAAEAFSAKAKTKVSEGDEVRLYVDKAGKPAQAIVSRAKGEGAVAYNHIDGFMWGALVETGTQSLLIGEGEPSIVVDLHNLAYWYQEMN